MFDKVVSQKNVNKSNQILKVSVLMIKRSDSKRISAIKILQRRSTFFSTKSVNFFCSLYVGQLNYRTNVHLLSHGEKRN